jgi:hypothetical protein
MLQSDLNEKYDQTDWKTVESSVKKAGGDANINSNIEISNRFDCLINEGNGESNDHEIPNETAKTKEKLNHQQKDSGKKQKKGSEDKTAHLNEKAKQSQNNGRDSTND